MIPAITTAVGKCISIYSRSLPALRTFYSLILSNGGITDACMNRLARLSDTVTHQNLLGKLNELAGRWDVSLRTWPQFNIVMDNVDMLVKPRHDDSSKSNKMYHMVQAIAVEDRVLTQADDDSRQPAISIATLKPTDVYPDQSDTAFLRGLFINKVIQLLGEMPALQNLELTKKPKHHIYSKLMSKKSNMVSN